MVASLVTIPCDAVGWVVETIVSTSPKAISGSTSLLTTFPDKIVSSFPLIISLTATGTSLTGVIVTLTVPIAVTVPSDTVYVNESLPC